MKFKILFIFVIMLLGGVAAQAQAPDSPVAVEQYDVEEVVINEHDVGENVTAELSVENLDMYLDGFYENGELTYVASDWMVLDVDGEGQSNQVLERDDNWSFLTEDGWETWEQSMVEDVLARGTPVGEDGAGADTGFYDIQRTEEIEYQFDEAGRYAFVMTLVEMDGLADNLKDWEWDLQEVDRDEKFSIVGDMIGYVDEFEFNTVDGEEVEFGSRDVDLEFLIGASHSDMDIDVFLNGNLVDQKKTEEGLNVYEIGMIGELGTNDIRIEVWDEGEKVMEQSGEFEVIVENDGRINILYPEGEGSLEDDEEVEVEIDDEEEGEVVYEVEDPDTGEWIEVDSDTHSGGSTDYSFSSPDYISGDYNWTVSYSDRTSSSSSSGSGSSQPDGDASIGGGDDDSGEEDSGIDLEDEYTNDEIIEIGYSLNLEDYVSSRDTYQSAVFVQKPSGETVQLSEVRKTYLGTSATYWDSIPVGMEVFDEEGEYVVYASANFGEEPVSDIEEADEITDTRSTNITGVDEERNIDYLNNIDANIEDLEVGEQTAIDGNIGMSSITVDGSPIGSSYEVEETGEVVEFVGEFEHDENLYRYSTGSQKAGIDLRGEVTDISVPESVEAGEMFDIGWTVQNRGQPTEVEIRVDGDRIRTTNILLPFEETDHSYNFGIEETGTYEIEVNGITQDVNVVEGQTSFTGLFSGSGTSLAGFLVFLVIIGSGVYYFRFY